MKKLKIKHVNLKIVRAMMAFILLVNLVSMAQPQVAADTASGAIGIQGVIPSAPPTRGATIAVPSNGAIFTNTPITVSGLCPSNLLVKVFSNNVFVGSTICTNGSYSLQVDLFSGRNDLVARVYDALDQAGPDSNTVTVTFQSAQFLQFGNHVYLSSAYAERGAPPNQELDWPILINGGTPPYALSIDWGDGTPTDLMSVANAGAVNIRHVYKQAGIYTIVIKATDKNGGEAFLQLVGQATGAIQSNSKGSGSNLIIEKQLLWWPALEMLPFIFIAFWIGRRHERDSQRKKFEKTFSKYNEK